MIVKLPSEGREKIIRLNGGKKNLDARLSREEEKKKKKRRKKRAERWLVVTRTGIQRGS